MGSIKQRRQIKSWCLFACLALLYVSQALMVGAHVFFGCLFFIFFIIHVAAYSKWFKALTKAFLRGKTKGKKKIKYLITCAIGVVFVLTFLMGMILLFQLLTLGEVSDDIHRIHNASAIVGGVLVLLHLVTRSSMKTKKDSPTVL